MRTHFSYGPALASKRNLIATLALGFFLISLGKVTPAAATTWTDWTSATTGTSGSASGSLNGVTVSYSGEVNGNTTIDGTSTIWMPQSSFVGGTVTISPDTVGDHIALAGATSSTNTITFSSPLTNPVFAIWSLGSKVTSTAASFTFAQTPTFQVGGPSLVPNSESITVAGDVVSGLEGNGVVQFTGTYSSISWTNTPENWYAFTVGVPEPATGMLLGLGLGSLVLVRRRGK